jgi:hypothetical protein
MNESHVLPVEALEGVDLPAETVRLLVTSGVPAELRLPEWLGPTLFHSEIGGGRLLSSTDPDAAIPRDAPGYEIGTVREIQGFPTAYAAFVLRPRTGEVWLLDRDSPDGDRFVNRSLATFLASIEGFRVAWPRLVAEDDDRESFVEGFRDLLVRLDPECLSAPEHYWPGWLEELE